MCVFFLKEEEHSGHWGAKLETNSLVGNKGSPLEWGLREAVLLQRWLSGDPLLFPCCPCRVLHPLPTLPEVGVDTWSG